MWALIFFIALLVVLALATGADMRDERDTRDAVRSLYMDVYRRDDLGRNPRARRPRHRAQPLRRLRQWRDSRL